MTTDLQLPSEETKMKWPWSAKTQSRQVPIESVQETQSPQVPEKSVHETQVPITNTDEPSSPRLDSTTTDTPQLQKWNYPRSNIPRVLSTFWCFIILGANDAAFGALIPYLEVYYNIDYLTVSCIFLAPIVGYVSSALTNDLMHMNFGQRGVGAIMSACHIIAYVVLAFHPPYPALVVILILAGYGNGLGDSAWNAWIGAMANSNEILGFLHAFYGLGALLSPLIATSLITKAGWQWYQFYYLLIGASVIEFVAITWSFWPCTAKVYRDLHSKAVEMAAVVQEQEDATSGTATPTNEPDTSIEKEPLLHRLNPFSQSFFMNPPPKSHKPKPATTRTATKSNSLLAKIQRFKSNSPTYTAMTHRVTILTSIFLLLYVGAEVSQGGWLITFLTRVRHGTPFASGMAGTGFWLGITVGRLILGFVTARLFPTEKHAVLTYLILSIIVQLLFWTIPNFTVSAVMASVLGFLIAPFFPAAVVMLAKNLPNELHVAAIGFCAALGASGATVMPFAVGAIAQKKGVAVLQPIILALLVGITVVWLLMPSLPRQRVKQEKGEREKRRMDGESVV